MFGSKFISVPFGCFLLPSYSLSCRSIMPTTFNIMFILYAGQSDGTLSCGAAWTAVERPAPLQHGRSYRGHHKRLGGREIFKGEFVFLGIYLTIYIIYIHYIIYIPLLNFVAKCVWYEHVLIFISFFFSCQPFKFILYDIYRCWFFFI